MGSTETTIPGIRGQDSQGLELISGVEGSTDVLDVFTLDALELFHALVINQVFIHDVQLPVDPMVDGPDPTDDSFATVDVDMDPPQLGGLL